MRRLVIVVLLAAPIVLIVSKMAPAMRSRSADACEKMLATMPESFPPNRMMADLESIKEQTARILDVIDHPADDSSQIS